MEMADNHVREDSSAGENPYGAAAEGIGDSVDQMDPIAPNNDSASDSFRSEVKETRAAEEGVREDMFVDCPDEIETSESQQNSEEKDHDLSNELDSGIQVDQVVAEIELLRDKLEKSVSEKEHLAQEYEEERAMLMRELSQLCNQLKVSNGQEIAANENIDGFVQDIGSGTSLHEMISECSRFLKNAIDERLHTEETVRELHSVIYLKDQEIDYLNGKVADITESSNTAQSNSISEHDKLSQLYEVQLEKDRHIEEIANRLLASLATVHHQEELQDGPLSQKISNIEKSVTFLVEKCNLFVSGSSQLKECLNDVGPDFDKIEEIEIFVMARNKILELRRKEDEMHRNISSAEDQNRKLVEELEKQKSTAENMSAEIGRLSAEVEHERNRYANTKEKLSMAVTKGKALVQQRDSLKQTLLEKTSELGKISVELQEKTSALEAAEKTKELAAASETFVAALHESLREKETILQKCGEILSESFEARELQSTDITEKLRWLADENKSLRDISLQYHKLTDTLWSFDFPETVASSEFDVRVRWLAESFYMSREEATKLNSEIAKTKEAAEKEIEHLFASLLAEMQDRSYLQAELDEIRGKCEAHERLQHELAAASEGVTKEIDRLTSSLLAESEEKSHLRLELENLRQEYEGLVEKENLASLEKDKIVTRLLEASGLLQDGQQEVHPWNSDLTTIVDNCLLKIRELAYPKEPSLVEMETFESFKSLLYIRDQEMTLCELIIEEDSLVREHASHLTDELEMKTQELNALKDEKVVMQKSFNQLEERCALLKDKLSMAVKKGKGLVQDRENLKGSLNEKDTEIDSLKSELQQYLAKYAECQEQITKLSLDVERVSLLETDLVSAKERGDQLEQFLAESNSVLQRLMESIEGITTPTNLSFSDPVEKLKWVSIYLGENEISKAQVEQELKNVKDEASSLASKLSEVQAMMESLENSLSIAENSRSELLDEKKDFEVSRALLEEELQKEKEKASSLTSKFEELLVRNRELEDALSLAENNASRFINERNLADETRTLAEEQMKKLKEELSDHVTRLDETKDFEVSRALLEEELQKEKEKASSLTSKFEELLVRNRELEDALSLAEDNASRFINERNLADETRTLAEEQMKKLKEELSDHVTRLDETKDFEVSRALLEEELQKEKEKASSLTSKFEELLVRNRELEDALLLAKDNASRIINERNVAEETRTLAEEQMNKLKEELSDHVTRLADADKTIQSLEDALSQAQKNISLLAAENSKVETGRTDLDGEIKRIREEAHSYATKLSEASVTIKSLEDALLHAENSIADLVEEKKNAEQETVALTSKLESCMEELAGTRNSIENRYLELSGQLSRLQLLIEDETFSTSLGQCFQKKTESLNSIDFLLREMWDCFLEMDSDVLQNGLVMEDGSSLLTALPFNSAPNMEMLNGGVDAVDTERIIIHIEKMVEKFHLKGKTLADTLDNLSTLMDHSIAGLLRKLYMTKDKITGATKYMNSLKDQLEEIKTDRKRQDDTIMLLESDIRVLNSACVDATEVLELNVLKNVSELKSIHELVNLDSTFVVSGAGEDYAAIDHVKKAEKLLLATRQNQDLSKLFQDAISKLMNMSEDMQNQLKETQLTHIAILEERDQYKDKALKLEADLIAQESLYREMETKVEEFKEREDAFRKREAELSTSLSEFHELEDILSVSQVKSILDKINQVKVPDDALSHGNLHDSADVRKLFYVIDSFSNSLQKVSALSHENEELQSTVDEQILEIEQLKRQVEDLKNNEKDSEKMNNLSELESGLHIIVRKLGGGDLMDDSKVNVVYWNDLIPVVDKLVTAIIFESENLKVKNEELGTKLIGAQKAVDDLSNKVKILEESNQARGFLPEADQERSTSISPLSAQSEISEIHDVGALGIASSIPSTSSAAHARTLRKGSSDHLAISIEPESERFITDKGSDDDKGHVFKSLISSGLIPRQGRTVADRIDGIWVSGSRVLMNHPRGRLGLLAYWLVLHVWLLGAIL